MKIQCNSGNATTKTAPKTLSFTDYSMRDIDTPDGRYYIYFAATVEEMEDCLNAMEGKFAGSIQELNLTAAMNGVIITAFVHEMKNRI